MGNEVIGDRVQGKLGNFEFVLGDQAEQQVEWAFEVIESNAKPAVRINDCSVGLSNCVGSVDGHSAGDAGATDGSSRKTSSRASDR